MDVDARVRAFLAATLKVWGVEAALEPLPAPKLARILGDGGPELTIERAHELPGFRWIVSTQAAEGTAHARPCASLVGLLGALRRALGVAAGSSLRIARDAS